jgi:hypothetical protein
MFAHIKYIAVHEELPDPIGERNEYKSRRWLLLAGTIGVYLLSLAGLGDGPREALQRVVTLNKIFCILCELHTCYCIHRLCV